MPPRNARTCGTHVLTSFLPIVYGVAVGLGTLSAPVPRQDRDIAVPIKARREETMRHARVSAMALMLAAVPAKAESQDDWWDWTLQNLTVHVEIGNGPARVRGVPDVVVVPARRTKRYRDRRDERVGYADPRAGKHGNGPAFCRSGAGHPVHGRRWCVEKGFGLGVERAHDMRWERRYWDDVVFGRRWTRARGGYVDGGVLVDVVGRRVYGRLDIMRRRMGVRYALTGRWIRPRGGALVLQVRAGPMALAELSDVDGDGRVDVVLVASL